MVQEVKAFKTESGQVFTQELDALEYETRAKLQQCLGGEEYVEAIMQHLLGVHSIIEPIVAYIEASQVTANRSEEQSRG